MKLDVAFVAAAIAAFSIAGAAPIAPGGASPGGVVGLAERTTSNVDLLEAREPQWYKLSSWKTFPIPDDPIPYDPEGVRSISTPQEWAREKSLLQMHTKEFEFIYERKPGLDTEKERKLYMRKKLLWGAPTGLKIKGKLRYLQENPPLVVEIARLIGGDIRDLFRRNRNASRAPGVPVNQAEGGVNQVQGNDHQMAGNMPHN